MAYNYLGLTNDVCRRLNEVELSASNFTSTTGFYSFAKDAVNSAIRHINQEEFEWPWNHVEETEVLTTGQTRYSFPYDAKTLNLNTFRIKRNNSLNVETRRVKNMVYEEWLDKYADIEYNSDSSIRGVPSVVARTPSREFVLYPTPDKDYELVYEYYRLAHDLQNALDVPNLPEQYRYLIIDGAMHYVYQFRSDMQAAQLALQSFDKGLKNLRSLHVNRTDYVRDSRVHF
jgi:hypothetical protein